MKSSLKTFFTRFIILFSAITAVTLFVLWYNATPPIKVSISRPGADNTPNSGIRENTVKVHIGEFFRKFPAVPVQSSPNWPRFRGEDSDNIVKNSSILAEHWLRGEPEILWSIKLLGEGHAAPAVYNGRVYLLDYNEKERADTLRCLSLANGKEIWRRWYHVKAKRNHGISRTIPAVTDKYTVTIGPRCHVMCVDSLSGDFKWGLDLVEDFGTKEPLWFTGQCPLIINDTVIIAPCGKKALMMGVDCRTGKIIWKTPNIDNWNMSHSSIMPVTLYKKKAYVYAALGGIVAVSAEKGMEGKLLWKTSEWDCPVIAPSVLYLGNGYFFITSGYGAGSMVFKVERDNSIKIVSRYKPQKGLASEQQTPLICDGYVYGIQPKDGGKLRKKFVCYSVNDLKTPIWSSSDNFGLGPYIIADNKIYILDDRGTLTMIKLSSRRYQVLGKAKIMNGHDAWGPIAVTGDKLLLRDLTRLYCLDIGTKKSRHQIDKNLKEIQ
jgi:outer membrane protein assembly factor BamB